MFEQLRERVVTANLELVRLELAILTFGNASAADRDVGVMAIKPSGVPYHELTVESVPVLDLTDGTVLDGDCRPSSDTPTHLALYRAFAEIGGVVHTHSPYATAWAQACRPIPCLGTTHADHFRGPVPVTRALTAEEIAGGYEEATGAVIVELGIDPRSMPAALVASHAPFTWGDDVETAVENAVALEAVAASTYRALVLHSGCVSIDDRLLAKHFDRKHGPGAYYGQPT
ncbi:MAG TPA: L-ribulose-5-phosphate 4-epimerase AraD [Gaiellaceae bacterium]|jgi:L-ribulose-5-phosphate 4-epimerase